MSDATDLRRRIEAALMQHAKADDELQAKIADKEGGRIVFDIEELAGVPDLEALLLDCLPFLSAPAVPDDVASLSAAREAAAAMAMREAAAKEIDCEGCGGKCYDPGNCWQSAAADIRDLPLPDTAALDRLIAERVDAALKLLEPLIEKRVQLERAAAVEAEREACRQIVQSVINDPRTKFWGDLAEARARIVARGSNEGRDG